MQHIRIFLTLVALICGASCNSTPSAPTPPPPPPVADPPELTCPASVTASARTSAGIAVSYSSPEVRKGQGNVTVACNPASDSLFPVGVTEAQCVATDALSRTGSCTFSVTVAAPPRLRRARIMAFGDSLTFGSTLLTSDPYLFSFPVETAYPTVLRQLLTARYTDQTITVFNSGLVGEQAFRALPRFTGTFAADMPDVVVLLEGINDLKVEGDIIGTPNALAGISELAGEARRRGARVFICTWPPGRSGRAEVSRGVIEYVNDRIRGIAQSEGAVLVDLFAALLPDVNAYVSIDGLHLTPLGYRRVAETVFTAIRNDLEVR